MSRAAPLGRATASQTSMELRLMSRRGESVLVMTVIPATVLVFFGSVDLGLTVAGRPTGGRAVDFLVPGALALAVIATGLVSLAIGTAFERHYGVLKRLGSSPLTRGGLLTAKLASAFVLEALTFAVLSGVAIAIFGWTPPFGSSVGLFLLAWVAGTVAFASIGFFLAGALRAEATLAVANALFLAAMLLGGIIVPVDRLPGILSTIASVLPAAALSESFRIALGAPGDPGPALLVLALWGAAAAGLAARTFRWDG